MHSYREGPRGLGRRARVEEEEGAREEEEAEAVVSKEHGKKKPRRGAQGSPTSPLDYSGSGASTSGGEEGAFCSQPAAPAHPVATAAAAPSSKVRASPPAHLASPSCWFGRLLLWARRQRRRGAKDQIGMRMNEKK